jgi:hypothetical protein
MAGLSGEDELFGNRYFECKINVLCFRWFVNGGADRGHC